MTGFRKVPFRCRIVALLCLVSAAAGLAACGSATTGGGANAAGNGGSTASTPSGASNASSTGGEAVSSLPSDMQPAYAGLDQPVGASAYTSFKPNHGPPWTIGYSSEYAGNSWRLASINELYKTLLLEYQKAGLVKKVTTLQSNLNDATQIQQIRQLVNNGADAIITCCPSPSSLNGAIAYAHSHGVPFFVYSGYATSPYAINTSANYVIGGEQLAAQLAKSMHDKGNVLDVLGIPGTASNNSLEQGFREEMKKHPNIKVAGQVAGQWTDQIVKTQVQKYLATHPAKIDGIFVQSPGEVGALQALQQSGRPMVPITVSGEVGTACYWSQHPNWVSGANLVWPPGPEMALSLSTAVRTLQGQGPKIQSIIRSPLPQTLDDMKKLLPANCSTSSVSWLGPEPNSWFPPDQLNQFFKNGSDPLAGN
jgi:ribose transport system substrate-binding protein